MEVPCDERRLGRIGLAAALALTCLEAQADIYRCVANGRTSFRDKPCAAAEKQSVLSLGNSRYAGCFAVDDAVAWEGGAGSWLLRVEHGEAGYVLREFRSVPAGKTDAVNVPLHRATPDELGRVTQLLRFSATSGMALQLPDQPVGGVPSGLFHIWDEEGKVRLVAVMPFVNGFANRVACP